jgi:D-3-phosphoglycerate dehydrogenase
MKLLVLGDLFITNAVLKSAMQQAFDGSDVRLEFDFLTDRWPIEPVQKTEEVREFVGSEDEVAAKIGDAEVAVTHTAPITEKVLAAAGNLKLVGAARGGPVNINWDACTRRGIPVLYAPGRNSGAVAEFTIGLMLAESRRITRAHMSMMTEKRWRGDFYLHEEVGLELNSAVVGLVGFGAIGSKVARLLYAFGSDVLVFDPYVTSDEIQSAGCKPVTLEHLLTRSDFVSLHARLTPESEGMIGAEQIERMKPSAYLINTARGGLIDHDALYAALRDERIAGAALDIFEAEPPEDDSPLYALKNVTATSHLAGASIQAAEIGAAVLAEGVYEFMAGSGVPSYCVNPEVLTQGD